MLSSESIIGRGRVGTQKKCTKKTTSILLSPIICALNGEQNAPMEKGISKNTILKSNIFCLNGIVKKCGRQLVAKMIWPQFLAKRDQIGSCGNRKFVRKKESQKKKRWEKTCRGTGKTRNLEQFNIQHKWSWYEDDIKKSGKSLGIQLSSWGGKLSSQKKWTSWVNFVLMGNNSPDSHFLGEKTLQNYLWEYLESFRKNTFSSNIQKIFLGKIQLYHTTKSLSKKFQQADQWQTRINVFLVRTGCIHQMAQELIVKWFILELMPGL